MGSPIYEVDAKVLQILLLDSGLNEIHCKAFVSDATGVKVKRENIIRCEEVMKRFYSVHYNRSKNRYITALNALLSLSLPLL